VDAEPGWFGEWEHMPSNDVVARARCGFVAALGMERKGEVAGPWLFRGGEGHDVEVGEAVDPAGGFGVG
jgi:hypothetical protein